MRSLFTAAGAKISRASSWDRTGGKPLFPSARAAGSQAHGRTSSTPLFGQWLAGQLGLARELAYFYADHDVKLGDALALAQKELEIRQDIYAHDILAWALYKNGQPAQALAPITAALNLGTKDAKLHFHAGMIYQDLGKTDLAREHLRRALTLNPHFSLLQAPMAQRALKTLDAKP